MHFFDLAVKCLGSSRIGRFMLIREAPMAAQAHWAPGRERFSSESAVHGLEFAKAALSK